MLQLAATMESGAIEIRRADGVTVASACGSGNAAFSASELLAASLAGCVVASLAPLLGRHGLDVASLHVRVSPRGAALADGLEATVALPRCEPSILARCRRAAETCPVGQSLNIPLEFHWQTT